MSWRWRAELRVDLHRHGCVVRLLQPGWAPTSTASASAAGQGATALREALAALTRAEVRHLPGNARLYVADEYVLHLRLAADTGLSRDELIAQAEHLFAHAVGPGERHISLLPLDSRHWLASAVDMADVNAWRAALDEAGIKLAQMTPVLHHEWPQLQTQLHEQHGLNDPLAVLALIREEGATLIRLERGVAVDVLWERVDPQDSVTLERRLRAFARDGLSQARARPAWANTHAPEAMGALTTGVSSRASAVPLAVYLRLQSHSLCRYVWDLSADEWSEWGSSPADTTPVWVS